MNLVIMKEVGDCGPACLAMVLGKTLEDVTKDFPDRYHRGVSEEEMVGYLADHKVPSLASLVWPHRSVPAILTVPSLNHLGLLHFVVWDGTQILDPSEGPKVYPEDTPLQYKTASIPVPWVSTILLWSQYK